MMTDGELKVIGMEQRTQVGVACPKCQWRQFIEVEIDPRLMKSPLAGQIQVYLEEWMLYHCPDHLEEFLKASKN